MQVQIITDSASDLVDPGRADVTVIPMSIAFGEDAYRDGVDLSHERFFELLVECEHLPSTSQIPPDQFLEAFREQVDAGNSVVAVVMSGKLSGTWQSACLAAREFPGKVFVVDSENASIGERILVERAVRLKDQGLDAEQIAHCLEKEKKDICLVALLDTLEYLKRGGRISRSVAAIGGILSIKPVISLQGGEVCMLGKARGSRNGSNLLVQEIGKTRGIDFAKPYLLGYSGFSDACLHKYMEDSRQLWEGHVGEGKLPVGTIGATIGTHIGPGAIGVAFFQKEET